MRAYIAGPMTGLPDFNYEAFHAAAVIWREDGWDVLNPAESFDGRSDLPYDWYLREAVRLVSIADAIVLLPGWARSKGALLELHIAVVLGLEVYDHVTMVPVHMTLEDVAGWVVDTHVLQPNEMVEVF